MIWWSERSRWGHFYLYSVDGELQNAITSGAWQAEQLLSVDTARRELLVAGYSASESHPNYRHHWRVHLDGRAPRLLHPDDLDHLLTLSPSRRYAIDRASRPDIGEVTAVRGSLGTIVHLVSEQRQSALRAVGRKPPTRVIVRAAEGKTLLYGLLWLPHDAASGVHLPVVLHQYPGHRRELVNTRFELGGFEERLAQLGFAVLQIGARGSHPLRGRAYRDYAYGRGPDAQLEDYHTLD